jgi:DNA-3-methyladenine glycosylase I
MTYCQAVLRLDETNRHRIYHDKHYGFPIHDDAQLFGRLILEINQAGLSWDTILRKQEAFHEAYDHYDIAKIAAYGDADKARLLANPGIIRNRLKIAAAIHNANVVLALQMEFGSFEAWLDRHHPKSLAEWTKLFKQTFRFVGGEIVNEFLMSTGYLKGSHEPSCPIHAAILQAKPAWTRSLE